MYICVYIHLYTYIHIYILCIGILRENVFFGNEKSVRYVLTRRPSLFAVEEAQMLAMLRYHIIIPHKGYFYHIYLPNGPSCVRVWVGVGVRVCVCVCV